MHAAVLGEVVRAVPAAAGAPFGARLLGAVLVLGLGWGVSLLLDRGVAALLEAVGFDDLTGRGGGAGRRTWGGSAARAVRRSAVWLLRLVTVLIALDLLDWWSPMPQLIPELLDWLPVLAGALVVLLLTGFVLGLRRRGWQDASRAGRQSPPSAPVIDLGLTSDPLLAGADGRAVRSGYDRRRLTREGPDRRISETSLPG